ncbi:MAG: DUF4038 domain-containing protein [Verrucomicrobiales bacterium]|nr:DUF4038 domain-containing protein [Verrucomicrobiales bacterium]
MVRKVAPAILGALLLLVTADGPAEAARVEETIFPLRVSPKQRHFVTSQGKPFLYHADTGWQILSRLTFDEAREYLTLRKEQGFNTIQVQIAMGPTQTNRQGDLPFHGDVDFGRPNEAYHDHALRVIELAESMQLMIVLSQPWLGCCEEAFGNRPDKPIQRNGPTKNRQYGQYLGRKFALARNLFWIMGGDNDPKGDRIPLFAMIEGLRETAPPHQLMTYHASPPHSSTDLFQYAPWLGFSFIYTYWPEKPNDWVPGKPQPHVYEAALREWTKSDVMPFVLGESQYEGTGAKDNDMGTAQMARRQAYWAMLCGAAGHAYGSDLWDFPTNWREIVRYPGANQLGHFIRLFESIPWWTLRPDIRHEAVVAGYGEWGRKDYATTALSEDRRLMVAYLPELQSVTVNFARLAGEVFEVAFVDPRTGKRIKVETVKERTVRRLPSPTAEDLILMIEGR